MTTDTAFITPEPASTTLPPAPRAAHIHDDPSAEAAREDAFTDDFLWQGQLLQPLSLERYNIFVTQRLAMGAAPLGDALRDGGAFYPDALRLLWLCSHPPEILQRYRRDPDAMQTAIEAWAATHAPLHLAKEVIGTGLAVFNAAFENRHETRASTRTGRTSGN